MSGIRLKDQVCIITGAASGIGQGTAVRFAEEGAQLVLVDVNASGLAQTAQQVAASGAPAMTYQCDVSVPGEVDAMVEATVARFGRLDVMFANAGVSAGRRAFVEWTQADLDRMVEVNIKGVFYCGQAAARAMIKLGTPGRIVNTASMYAEVSSGDMAIYAATKGAVMQLTKAMAADLGKHGIRVNAVGPGYIRTPMNPMANPAFVERVLPGLPLGRVGTPQDIAGPVLFLASADSAYVTGVMLVVDGGWCLQ